MAFPLVHTTNISEEASDTTTMDVIMTGVLAGDRALMFANIDRDGTNVTISGMPAGWVERRQNHRTVGGEFSSHIWEKLNCTGSESNFTFTASLSQKSHVIVFLISGSSLTEALADSTGVASNPPDPGSLTPSWGAEDTLWIAHFASDNLRDEAISYPTNYDNNQNTATDTGGDSTKTNYGLATRDLNTATEDPGAFGATINGTTASTFAVRPGDATRFIASKLASSKRVLTPDPPLLLSDRKA